MASCFSASQISTRRNSTGSSPSRPNRGKQMIWSRTTFQQASVLSFLNVFRLMGVVFLVIVPLVLLLRKPKHLRDPRPGKCPPC